MTKREEAEAWLTKWAEDVNGTLEGLLSELAEFSLGNQNTFIYKGKVVGVFEGNDPADAVIREGDTDSELDNRGWIGDYSHELWAHYKTLTGVSPWAKDCRGC